MVFHLVPTATLTGYFGSTGYEKEAQKVKKKIAKVYTDSKMWW